MDNELTLCYCTPKSNVISDELNKGQKICWHTESVQNLITACGVPCEVIKTTIAPHITTYHIKLHNPMQITQLKTPLAVLETKVHCKVKRTMSDCADFAVEIPNVERQLLTIRECMLTEVFNNHKPITRTCLGATTENKPLVLSVSDMPHILIAGATGSGKSVLLNSMIVSMLFSETPSTLQLVMIDPKKVELSKYEGLPHLGCPIATDTKRAIGTLAAVCRVMDERYAKMASAGYKKASDMGLHSIVIIIDELADLMITSKYECEKYIIRLAQLGRAAGIHLIIATQRPTVNVITGLIKSNIPCKIALQTSSIRDSITILDHKGAESLIGKGDALLKLPTQVEEIRFQSAYVSDENIERVVNYWKNDSIKMAIPN